MWIARPDDEMHIEDEFRGPAQGYSGKYVDDMSTQVLKDSLVHAARAKELLYFNSKGVWHEVLARRRFRRPDGPPSP